MGKIQCPHCKAVNQDVGMDDPCWQCGTVLGAPVSAIDTGSGPASSDVNPANSTGSSSLPIQKQIDRDNAQMPGPVIDGRAVKKGNLVSIAAVVIALIVVVVVLYLKLKH